LLPIGSSHAASPLAQDWWQDAELAALYLSGSRARGDAALRRYVDEAPLRKVLDDALAARVMEGRFAR